MATSMPPPPTDTPVSGAGSGSTGDKLKSFLVNLTGGGMPMVKQQLDDAHAKRTAEAERNHQQYGQLSQLLAGDTKEQYVKKDGTLTPEGQQKELQRKAAFDAWQKAAGVSKESKSIIGKLGQFTDKLVHHRAGGQPPQPGQGAGPAASGMPAPPQAAAPVGEEGAKGGSGMPAPSSASPSASGAQMPPPPGYTPAGQDPGTLLARQQSDTAEAQKLDLYKKEGQTDADIKGQAATDAPKQLLDGLVKAGLSQEEAQKVVREKFSGIAGRPKPVMYTDPKDPTMKLFGTEVGGQVFDQSGEVVPNAGQIVPSMLPTSRTGEMPVFNPQTNQFEQQPTHSSSQKVAPKSSGGKSTGMPAPPNASGNGKAASPAADGGRHGIPARQFNILQKQATSIDEARNSLIGDDPKSVGGLAQDLQVFKRKKSVDRLANYLGLVTSTVENEAKQVTGQGPMAAAEWYLQLPQTVVGLQQGALADASRSLDDGAPDGPEHRFVADYFRTLGTIGGLRASTGASAAKWSFNTLRSELPTPGPVTSYPEALRRVKNIVQETNVVAKRNPLVTKADDSKLDDIDAVYARDPQGKLHKRTDSKAALPKGWTLENGTAGK